MRKIKKDIILGIFFSLLVGLGGKDVIGYDCNSDCCRSNRYGGCWIIQYYYCQNGTSMSFQKLYNCNPRVCAYTNQTKSEPGGNACPSCTPTDWQPALCPASCQRTRTVCPSGATETQSCTGGSCMSGGPAAVEIMRIRYDNTDHAIAGVEVSVTQSNKLYVRKGGKTFEVQTLPVGSTDLKKSKVRVQFPSGPLALKCLKDNCAP